MNILYIAHRIPYPPDKGDKIRTFHQIRQLAKENQIYLACLVDDRSDLVHVRTLQKYCRFVEPVWRDGVTTLANLAMTIATRKPLSVAAFFRKRLAEKVTEWIHERAIDVIVVSSSSVAQYVLDVPNIPKVVDFIDLDSEKWRLYAAHYHVPFASMYRLEASRLAGYERQVARAFDHCIFISRTESSLFERNCIDGSVSVIPNGVDLEYFGWTDQEVKRKGGRPAIVFTGVMDYLPNIDAVKYFCAEVLPFVRGAVPDVRFLIVGRRPTRQVRNLTRERNVVVTGAVPDVRPYLKEAMVAVAPFRLARGLQNKVLEAMAMGLPVVGTSQAFQSMEITEEDGVRSVDDPQQFAETLVKLLQCSPEQRHEFGRKGRQYVERHHRWEMQGAKLEKVLADVVNNRRRRSAVESSSLSEREIGRPVPAPDSTVNYLG